MEERYFSATAMGGRLYVQNVPDRGRSWESRRLVRLTERQVDLIYQPLAGDRKVKTSEELAEAVRVSERGLPAIKVWIHESLEDAARKFWEESHTGSRM